MTDLRYLDCESLFLVQRLTETKTDRLKEERQRGLTIELGQPVGHNLSAGLRLKVRTSLPLLQPVTK